MPVGSTNYKNVCILTNCGKIAFTYEFYYFWNPYHSGSTQWLDIDLSGGTAFTLELFACKFEITFPALLAES